MGYELDRAQMEASRNEREDAYFEARPQINTFDRRKVFAAGFERGWDARALYADARQKAEHESNQQPVEVSPNAQDQAPQPEYDLR